MININGEVGGLKKKKNFKCVWQLQPDTFDMLTCSFFACLFLSVTVNRTLDDTFLGACY